MDCRQSKYSQYTYNIHIFKIWTWLFKSEARNVYTEEINKIARGSNDGKRWQTFDKITSYPYVTNAGKVCKTELLEYLNIND